MWPDPELLELPEDQQENTDQRIHIYWQVKCSALQIDLYTTVFATKVFATAINICDPLTPIRHNWFGSYE